MFGAFGFFVLGVGKDLMFAVGLRPSRICHALFHFTGAVGKDLMFAVGLRLKFFSHNRTSNLERFVGKDLMFAVGLRQGFPPSLYEEKYSVGKDLMFAVGLRLRLQRRMFYLPKKCEVGKDLMFAVGLRLIFVAAIIANPNWLGWKRPDVCGGIET